MNFVNIDDEKYENKQQKVFYCNYKVHTCMIGTSTMMVLVACCVVRAKLCDRVCKSRYDASLFNHYVNFSRRKQSFGESDNNYRFDSIVQTIIFFFVDICYKVAYNPV